jgi:hypothetical protein
MPTILTAETAELETLTIETEDVIAIPCSGVRCPSCGHPSSFSATADGRFECDAFQDGCGLTGTISSTP